MDRPKIAGFLNSWFWINFWNIVINIGLGLVLPIAIATSLFIIVMYVIELRQFNKQPVIRSVILQGDFSKMSDEEALTIIREVEYDE